MLYEICIELLCSVFTEYAIELDTHRIINLQILQEFSGIPHIFTPCKAQK